MDTSLSLFTLVISIITFLRTFMDTSLSLFIPVISIINFQRTFDKISCHFGLVVNSPPLLCFSKSFNQCCLLVESVNCKYFRFYFTSDFHLQSKVLCVSLMKMIFWFLSILRAEFPNFKCKKLIDNWITETGYYDLYLVSLC